VLIDLSHTIRDGLVTHKGLPGPVICDYLSREASRERYTDGTEFQIGRIDMVANTGTYVDVPFHRFADGADLSEVALERFVDLPAIVIELDDRDTDVTGKAVLVRTGWARHFGTPAYLEDHPFVGAELAERLRGAVLVGIDSHNIDDTRTRNSRPVHTLLLGAGIPIVEHMRGLELLPANNFTFTAVPPKLAGMGTFPVRAFATILSIVALLSACEKSKQEAPAAGRPAVVTAEMAETFELYVAAFEKLTADIDHAGADCKAVLAVVQRDTKEVIAPLAPRGDKLHDAMAGLKGDPAATDWFALTFTPRMQTSSLKLIPLESRCARDADLHAALDEAMSMFPMMRKKK
jgi:arylformamidase